MLVLDSMLLQARERVVDNAQGHAALPSPRDVKRGLAGSDDEEKDGTREHADGDVWTCDEA